VEEGIVPGGGVALINAVPALADIKMEFDDEQTGVAIVRRALEEPMRQLAVNAGKDGAVIVDNVRRQQKEQDDAQVGYDVLREVYVNMVKQGIIDPVKVTRSAVENAASIGAMILTTEALITDIPRKKKRRCRRCPNTNRERCGTGATSRHVVWPPSRVLKTAGCGPPPSRPSYYEHPGVCGRLRRRSDGRGRIERAVYRVTCFCSGTSKANATGSPISRRRCLLVLRAVGHGRTFEFEGHFPGKLSGCHVCPVQVGMAQIGLVQVDLA
jgi:hypothetical protein